MPKQYLSMESVAHRLSSLSNLATFLPVPTVFNVDIPPHDWDSYPNDLIAPPTKQIQPEDVISENGDDPSQIGELSPEHKDILHRGGLEILGMYFPSQRIICINVEKCARVERDLTGGSTGRVSKIVLIHELAHFVTHMGIGPVESRTWVNFSEESSETKEKLAQALTFFYLSIFSPSALRLFRVLSEHAPLPYRHWLEIQSAVRDTTTLEEQRSCFSSTLQVLSERLQQDDRSIADASAFSFLL